MSAWASSRNPKMCGLGWLAMLSWPSCQGDHQGKWGLQHHGLGGNVVGTDLMRQMGFFWTVGILWLETISTAVFNGKLGKCWRVNGLQRQKGNVTWNSLGGGSCRAVYQLEENGPNFILVYHLLNYPRSPKWQTNNKSAITAWTKDRVIHNESFTHIHPQWPQTDNEFHTQFLHHAPSDTEWFSHPYTQNSYSTGKDIRTHCAWELSSL